MIANSARVILARSSRSKSNPTPIFCHPRLFLHPAARLRMPANNFGLYKVVRLHGSRDSPHDPDNSVLPEDLQERSQSPVEETSTQGAGESTWPLRSELYPFPNLSSYRLSSWFWSDNGEKSQCSFHDLIDVVGSEEFRPEDVWNVNWREVDNLLAVSGYEVDDMDSKEWVNDGILWKSVPVSIHVPFSKNTSSLGNHPFTVEGFHYRPLTPIIWEKLESSAGCKYFHTLGHELHWNPGDKKEHVCVYGELYTSPMFLQAYEELQVGGLASSGLRSEANHPS